MVICYHSFQNFLSSCLGSKHVEMYVYSITVVHLTVREDRRWHWFFLEQDTEGGLLLSNREEHEGWKHLHHEGLHNVGTAPKAREVRWTWHVARIISMRDVCRILVAKHNGDEAT